MKQIKKNLNQIEYPFSLNCQKNLSSSNCIYYGPICYYPRRGQAPTLLTGRRSKFEQLHGEELIQRELRRQKNKFLSQKLKEKRENILNELIQQIKLLEQKQFYLQKQIEQLYLYKKELNDKLNNLKEDPLFNLINHKEIPLFFQEYDHSSFDNISLINNFTNEQSFLDDLLLLDFQ